MKKDWQIKKLGEVCEKLYAGGDKPKNFSKEKTDEYQIPIYANGVTDNGLYGYTDKPIETQKSLTISARGTIGFSCIRTEPFVPIVRLIVLVPSEYINIDFLNYCCQTLVITNTGSSIPQLTIPMIRDYLIPIPPLEEQKRIVTVLDKKFAQIETLKTAAEKNLQNTKQLFQAELEKAFSNSDFDRCLLGDIITVLTDFNANGGYAKLDSNVRMYDEPNYAVMIRTTDLERNDFNHGVKYVDKNAYDMLSKSTLFGNEIIMNKIGSAGKIYLMPCLNRPATLARNAFLIRLKETVDVRFIFLYLSSPEGTAAIMKHVHGAVTKTITKDEVRSIIVPLPPLEEQKRIVAHLDSLSEKVHQLEEIYTKQLADCDELKQSLLQKAFEGEL
ncbi:MAG: restriction endonuclease subunit S [Treponema sp.]|nr:restriction endonuclease subunit S [Treponema sp.]